MHPDRSHANTQTIAERTQILLISASLTSPRSDAQGSSSFAGHTDKPLGTRIGKPAFAATSSAVELVGLADKFAWRHAG